jgi:hypothetical protein
VRAVYHGMKYMRVEHEISSYGWKMVVSIDSHREVMPAERIAKTVFGMKAEAR